VVAVIAAAAVWWFKPDPPVRYERVEVPKEVIIEQEPDTVVRWRERVVYRTPEPTQIAVAVDAAIPAVESFCRPVATMHTDTVVVDPQVLLRSVTTNPGWFLADDDITMIGVSNTGALKAFHYSVRPGWSARTVGDSLLVRSPRFGVARPLLELTAAGAAGWLLHSLIGG